MAWWIICFMATLITIGIKWYFATGLARMRQTLSRQQREAIELKGSVQDMRQAYTDAIKQVKSREADIVRLKKRIAEQNVELQKKQAPPE